MSPWETIPGETPIDPSGLKRKEVKTRRQLAVVEAENVLKATIKYLAAKPSHRLAPFDLTWTLRLHREMFGEVWEWAGKPRKIALNIGVAWYQVESELLSLLKDLRCWESAWPDIFRQTACLHHRAVRIHPFLNGNGRWARMLANIWLRLHDCPVTQWPEEAIGAVSVAREEYLGAIRQADEGEIGPLWKLHRQYAGGTPTNEEA